MPALHKVDSLILVCPHALKKKQTSICCHENDPIYREMMLKPETWVSGCWTLYILCGQGQLDDILRVNCKTGLHSFSWTVNLEWNICFKYLTQKVICIAFCNVDLVGVGQGKIPIPWLAQLLLAWVSLGFLSLVTDHFLVYIRGVIFKAASISCGMSSLVPAVPCFSPTWLFHPCTLPARS